MAATRSTSSSRKPAAKRKPSGAKRMPSNAKRGKKKRSGLHIEQRHFDLAGLGLVALAVFLGFVIYRDRDGGEAGRRAVEGLEWLLGDMTFGVPPALAAIGAILVLRPVLPAVRPFRAGGLCLLLAAALWLGASDGGKVGELLEGVVGRLVGDFGVSVLAIFLFIAAVLLLTGASVAGVLKATSDSVADTTRAIRTAAPARRPAAAPARTTSRTRKPVVPPEDDTIEPVVHQTAGSVSAGLFEPVDWEPAPEVLDEPEDPIPPVQDPLPDLEPIAAFDDAEPEEEEPEAAEVQAATRAVEVGPEDLTPQGRYRPHITEDPDFEWRMPAPELLQRSSSEQLRPDTAGQARRRRTSSRRSATSACSRRSSARSPGPHITRYELRLAPGHQDEQGLPAQGRPRLRAGRDRHPHPRAGARQDRRRRRGAQPAPPIVQLGDVFTEPPRTGRR
jgi:S-DNA-T family DNA segregation ATPase FtsK/SpoIIIE